MSEIVKNRSEIVFLYDIKDANPNGDPMDENKPRIDEETDINIVTDVRLKRTIRDYLHNFKDQNIFIIEEIKDDGTQKTREERIAELQEDLKKLKIKDEEKLKKEKETLLNKYIDLRLFGATIALAGEKGARGRSITRKKLLSSETKEMGEKGARGRSITWIGPVQFRFGRSLHRVEPKTIKGTSVMPSKEEVTRGTFIETQILPYSLINFYGIINENAAKNTGLKEEDIDLLMDGLWNGTRNLITRSKIGQVPRFLFKVVYKENDFHIGDLDKKIELLLKEDVDEKEIRDISEVKLNISKLMDTLKDNKDKIERIDFKVDKYVDFVLPDKEITGEELKDSLKEITQINELDL